MSIRRYFALVFVFSSIGCASFQDHEYRAAQKFRAKRAWWCNPDYRCSSNPQSHYSYGWRQGYTDVLMGGDGECPPVPPQCYWSHKYQSERGQCWVADWFQGYQHGAAAALAFCEGNLHPVPISDAIRQCSPDCLGIDHAAYPYGRTTLGVKPGSSDSKVETGMERINPVAPPSINPAPAYDAPTEPSRKAPVVPEAIAPDASSNESSIDSNTISPSPSDGSSTSDPVVPPAPVTGSTDRATLRGKWVALNSMTNKRSSN